MHWTFTVMHMRDKEICYYDSIGNDGCICTSSLLRCLKDEWKSQHCDVRNDWCGLKIVGYTKDIPIQPNYEFSNHHLHSTHIHYLKTMKCSLINVLIMEFTRT